MKTNSELGIGAAIDAAAYLANKQALLGMVLDGASARQIAAFVASLSPEHGGVAISQQLEGMAEPGTLAEAVFDILESGELIAA